MDSDYSVNDADELSRSYSDLSKSQYSASSDGTELLLEENSFISNSGSTDTMEKSDTDYIEEASFESIKGPKVMYSGPLGMAKATRFAQSKIAQATSTLKKVATAKGVGDKSDMFQLRNGKWASTKARMGVVLVAREPKRRNSSAKKAAAVRPASSKNALGVKAKTARAKKIISPKIPVKTSAVKRKATGAKKTPGIQKAKRRPCGYKSGVFRPVVIADFQRGGVFYESSDSEGCGKYTGKGQLYVTASSSLFSDSSSSEDDG